MNRNLLHTISGRHYTGAAACAAALVFVLSAPMTDAVPVYGFSPAANLQGLSGMTQSQEGRGTAAGPAVLQSYEVFSKDQHRGSRTAQGAGVTYSNPFDPRTPLTAEGGVQDLPAASEGKQGSGSPDSGIPQVTETQSSQKEDRERAAASESETAAVRIRQALPASAVRALCEGGADFQPVVVSEAISSIVPNPDSSHNAERAMQLLNGCVLLPGEEFSFNSAVGERETDRGFVKAPSIASGDTMTATVGGGICQVSSLCYLAAVKAGLAIDERHAHTLQVGYAQPGFDASVSWGQWDLRLTNTTGVPLLLLAEALPERGILKVSLLANGTNPNKSLTYVPVSKKLSGRTYRSFVSVRADGKEVDEIDLGTSSYLGTVPRNGGSG